MRDLFVHPLRGPEHAPHQLRDLEPVVGLEKNRVAAAAEQELVEGRVGVGERGSIREVVPVDRRGRCLGQDAELDELSFGEPADRQFERAEFECHAGIELGIGIRNRWVLLADLVIVGGGGERCPESDGQTGFGRSLLGRCTFGLGGRGDLLGTAHGAVELLEVEVGGG